MKPTRRQLFQAAGAVAVASTARAAATPTEPTAPGLPTLHYDAAVMDDVGDPEYLYWRNLGSLGGGMVIRRDMLKRR